MGIDPPDDDATVRPSRDRRRGLDLILGYLPALLALMVQVALLALVLQQFRVLGLAERTWQGTEAGLWKEAAGRLDEAADRLDRAAAALDVSRDAAKATDEARLDERLRRLEAEQAARIRFDAKPPDALPPLQPAAMDEHETPTPVDRTIPLPKDPAGVDPERTPEMKPKPGPPASMPASGGPS